MDLNEQMFGTMNSTKSCSDCHTTKTPLWRSGPSGPKSMCNACGIKYNKKRRALLGLNTGSKNKKRSGKGLKKQKMNEMGRQLKLRLVTLGGGEMVLQPEQKRRGGGGELGEEEQAAILLMALSCGSLYV